MIKNFTYIFIIFSLFSCVTSRRVNYLQEKEKKTPDSISVSIYEDYKLQVGDKLFIKISSLDKESKYLFSGGGYSDMFVGNSIPDLYTYTIYENGCIEFPYIGQVKMLGLTTREARDSMKVRLNTMIPDCDVDVRAINLFYTVIGDAGNGRFEIPKQKFNILQALAVSGDLTPFSDRAKIHLLRKNTNGVTEIHMLDLRDKNIIYSPYYYIKPNDVIYVQSYNGQFFGMDNFGSVLSTVSSTLSISYFIYYSFSTYLKP